MSSEQDRIRKIMEDMSRGKDIGNKLVYDRNTKTVRPAPEYSDPDGTTRFTPSDFEFFGRKTGSQS